ncbi:hypothetical protein GIB67_004296 [Kingdonia uniflora]|uniref:Glycosyltransferase n=1 Tax=Kingdonia uniflora TaxID=39325 RepID=A0A7J7MRN1_9MAGN|nr:hypothetical protein GIB67_004296 [Kingdonia uniflora]
MAPSSSPHIVLFPFMSKGHTIPLLHLARLLLRRGITVTVFTTTLNSPFIRGSLTDTKAIVIDLSFPENIPQLPPGVESTDKLPSLSLFIPFVNSTILMQTEFDLALQTLSNVTCIISDGFLGWTRCSALKLGVPRLVFYGMNNYAMAISEAVSISRPHAHIDSLDEPFTVPGFPWIKLTRNDLEPPFNDPNPKGDRWDFVIEQVTANMQSNGFVVNSFYELETKFVDHLNAGPGPKVWCVGPLCLADSPKIVQPQPKYKPIWMEWLDEKLSKGEPVLYVAFGSQAEITVEQLREIADGLEKSKVNFLWVVRSNGLEYLEEFKKRAKDKGLVINEWVDQVAILSHQSVSGFMSHCGWNSAMESICAAVPILAWPMMAEQHLNARMLVEELGVGVPVLTKNGSVRGFISSECIENTVKELMEGKKGKEARENVKEFRDLAMKAMDEDGSSSTTLDLLIEEVCWKN